MLNVCIVWRHHGHNFRNPDPIRTKFVIALDIPHRYPCVKFEAIVVWFAEVKIFYIFLKMTFKQHNGLANGMVIWFGRKLISMIRAGLYYMYHVYYMYIHDITHHNRVMHCFLIMLMQAEWLQQLVMGRSESLPLCYTRLWISCHNWWLIMLMGYWYSPDGHWSCWCHHLLQEYTMHVSA